MNNVHVVLVKVNSTGEPRWVAEGIEGMSFASVSKLKSHVKNGFIGSNPDDVFVHTLSEFIDMCNNQEMDLEEWFISYVEIV